MAFNFGNLGAQFFGGGLLANGQPATPEQLQQRAGSNAMMNVAAALLQAKDTPGASFAGALGNAIMAGQQGYQGALLNAQQRQLLGSRADAYQAQAAQAETLANNRARALGMIGHSGVVPAQQTLPQSQAPAAPQANTADRLQSLGEKMMLGGLPEFGQKYLDAAAKLRVSNQPAAVQEYEYAKANGYHGSLLDFELSKRRASATQIKNEVNTGDNAFAKEFGKQNADEFFKLRGTAQDSVSSLRNNQQAEQLLDSGVLTGFGANFKLGLGKALQQAGIHLADDPIANTEAYSALRAQEVGRVIKEFGSGTGLSDADREYAQKMAAGQITMNEASLRKILDISNRANRNIIARYNKQASAIDPRLSPYPLTVELPQDLQPQQAPQQLNGPIVSQAPVSSPVDMTQPGPPLPGITRTIGGKTYVQHNGQWFEQ